MPGERGRNQLAHLNFLNSHELGQPLEGLPHRRPNLDPGGRIRLSVDGDGHQSAESAVSAKVDAPDQPVAVEDREDVVTEPPEVRR